MSTWRVRELACSCGHRMSARVALGAHVGRAPQVRTAVLDRTFHRFTCTCGITTAVDTSFEYIDVERRQLVLIGSVDERAAWRVLEARVQGTLVRALELGSPLASELVGTLVSRVVFGVEALREKLILAEAGLDDALVECVKVRAFATDPELARGRIVVEAVAPDESLQCAWASKIEPLASSTLELPASWVAASIRDRASLQARFPELFRGGYVDVDRLWPA